MKTMRSIFVVLLAIIGISAGLTACGDDSNSKKHSKSPASASNDDNVIAEIDTGSVTLRIMGNVPPALAVGAAIDITFTTIPGSGGVTATFLNAVTSPARFALVTGGYQVFQSTVRLATIPVRTFALSQASASFFVSSTQHPTLTLYFVEVIPGTDPDNDGFWGTSDLFPADPCSGRFLNDLVEKVASCPLTLGPNGLVLDLTSNDFDRDGVVNSIDEEPMDVCWVGTGYLASVNCSATRPALRSTTLAPSPTTFGTFYYTPVPTLIGPLVATASYAYSVSMDTGVLSLNQIINLHAEFQTPTACVINMELLHDSDGNPATPMVLATSGLQYYTQNLLANTATWLLPTFTVTVASAVGKRGYLYIEYGACTGNSRLFPNYRL